MKPLSANLLLKAAERGPGPRVQHAFACWSNDRLFHISARLHTNAAAGGEVRALSARLRSWGQTTKAPPGRRSRHRRLRDRCVDHPRGADESACISSIGNGKTIKEERSPAMSNSVPR